MSQGSAQDGLPDCPDDDGHLFIPVPKSGKAYCKHCGLIVKIVKESGIARPHA